MLDQGFVSNHPEEVRQMLRDRNMGTEILDVFLTANQARKLAVAEQEALAAEQNRVSEAIRLRKGKDVAELLQRATELKLALAGMVTRVTGLKQETHNALAMIPNMPHKSVYDELVGMQEEYLREHPPIPTYRRVFEWSDGELTVEVVPAPASESFNTWPLCPKCEVPQCKGCWGC